MTPTELAERVGQIQAPIEGEIAILGMTIKIPSGDIYPAERGVGPTHNDGPTATIKWPYIGRQTRTSAELRAVAAGLREYAAELDRIASVAESITRPAAANAAKKPQRGKVPSMRHAKLDMDPPARVEEQRA